MRRTINYWCVCGVWTNKSTPFFFYLYIYFLVFNCERKDPQLACVHRKGTREVLSQGLLLIPFNSLIELKTLLIHQESLKVLIFTPFLVQSLDFFYFPSLELCKTPFLHDWFSDLLCFLPKRCCECSFMLCWCRNLIVFFFCSRSVIVSQCCLGWLIFSCAWMKKIDFWWTLKGIFICWFSCFPKSWCFSFFFLLFKCRNLIDFCEIGGIWALCCWSSD